MIFSEHSGGDDLFKQNNKNGYAGLLIIMGFCKTHMSLHHRYAFGTNEANVMSPEHSGAISWCGGSPRLEKHEARDDSYKRRGFAGPQLHQKIPFLKFLAKRKTDLIADEGKIA